MQNGGQYQTRSLAKSPALDQDSQVLVDDTFQDDIMTVWFSQCVRQGWPSI